MTRMKSLQHICTARLLGEVRSAVVQAVRCIGGGTPLPRVDPVRLRGHSGGVKGFPGINALTEITEDRAPTEVYSAPTQLVRSLAYENTNYLVWEKSKEGVHQRKVLTF